MRITDTRWNGLSKDLPADFKDARVVRKTHIIGTFIDMVNDHTKYIDDDYVEVVRRTGT